MLSQPSRWRANNDSFFFAGKELSDSADIFVYIYVNSVYSEDCCEEKMLLDGVYSEEQMQLDVVCPSQAARERDRKSVV